MELGDRFLALLAAGIGGVVVLTMGALVLRDQGGAASAIISAGTGGTAQVINAIGNVAGGMG